MSGVKVYLNEEELNEIWLSLTSDIIRLDNHISELTDKEPEIQIEAGKEQGVLYAIRDKIARAREKISKNEA